VEAYNKIDCLPFGSPRSIDHEDGYSRSAFVSAKTGEGLERLHHRIAEQLGGQRVRLWLRLPPTAGRLRSRLYADGAVRQEHTAMRGDWMLDVEIARPRLDRLCCAEGIATHSFTCGDLPGPV
jgi:GTP-binding protein HflX